MGLIGRGPAGFLFVVLLVRKAFEHIAQDPPDLVATLGHAALIGGTAWYPLPVEPRNPASSSSSMCFVAKECAVKAAPIRQGQRGRGSRVRRVLA
jgi:hypothetical protein